MTDTQQERQAVVNWFAAGRITTELVYKIIIKRLAPLLHSTDNKKSNLRNNMQKKNLHPSLLMSLCLLNVRRKAKSKL
jgi:hypothetical protein